MVEREGADVGVAFDGDADRVAFMTETAEMVPGDIMTALLAQEILKQQPGATILYDLRASRTTPEVIAEAGGRPVITRVGHSFIKARMREEGAVFAGEVSGHFYFAPWYAESGLLAMVTMLRLLKESGRPLSELVTPLRDRYATSPELNFEVDDKEAVLAAIEAKYGPTADEILKLDGLTVRFPDWWTNVRPSGTEPLLRMIVEARSPELLAEKRAEIEELVAQG